ncbi:protein neprosin [Quercus suber]|uniref:protein neprosin n=1 Tax=Quercus suber TaxID=58331 RepID=UPI0032E04F78
MGNGNFPLPYLCNSGCITRMRIHDNSPTLKFPDWVETYTDDYNCYDVMYVGDYIEDPEFFYGGPVFLFERDRESEGMEKRITLRLLFVIALLVLSSVDVEGKARKITSEVNRKLKLLNKPAAKSIKSEDGDIIDCVDIYKQPAFDHPALKNHKIEMRPSISFPSDTTTAAKNESSQRVLSQIWHKSGSCPKGTIPQTSYLITLGYSYVGARGNINIWNPRVQSPDEYTTAQIWLKSGPGDSFESIEAGWMVNPKLFSDTQPRVFIRWTLDSYQKTGCINLICSGFVQTSQEIGLGSAIQPTSQRWGDQYEVGIQIDMDPNQKRWWLKFGDDVIGYWPFEILTYMQQKAVLVQWGGDVYSKNVKGVKPHTTTAMGSGDDASALLGAACYINKLRILDYSLQLKYPEWVHTDSEEPYCYSSLNYQKSLAFEPTLFFGGPGRSRYCP